MAKKTNSELFSSILYIALGILLAVFRHEAIAIAMTIAGIFFIVTGVLDVIKKNYYNGGVSLVIGIAIILIGNLLKDIIFIVLGILVAVKGVVALIDVLKRKPNVLEIIAPALTIALGIFLAFGDAAPVIVLVAGILLAVDGALGLIGSLINKK
ncbi:MAG: DUF308 domain-containing protein [Clostridia bacterium]|nr:DUF308 domain-containing protein [Clostridia bacterium]